ncbi:hypothetical protein M8C21_000236 [Ambrosia artemisiifolia]|uniref:Uncharacterized protein n=1 Tax=Ambrosia artemisiifolia TaxID=4212 RepID=A0AAD5C7B2_AMBAR|nr:hypothetical protein M8C21_000236 [Ambrosia artemisiifolia]
MRCSIVLDFSTYCTLVLCENINGTTGWTSEMKLENSTTALGIIDLAWLFVEQDAEKMRFLMSI